MKQVWKLLGPNRALYLAALAVNLIFCGACVVCSTVSGDLVNTVISSAGGGAGVFGLFIALSLARVVLDLASYRLNEGLRIRQKRHMRTQAFAAYTRTGGRRREETAAFSSFLNNDLPSIVEQFFIGLLDIVQCTFLIFFSAVSLVTIHWLLALIILASSALIVYLPRALREKGGGARKDFSQKTARYNTLLGSFLGGLHILRTYRCRDRAVELLEGANRDAAASEAVRLRVSLTVRGVTTVLQVVKTVLLFTAGAALIYGGHMTVGGLIAAIQLESLIASPIEVLAYLQHARNEVRPLVERYEDITRPAPAEEGRPCEGGPIRVEHVSCRAGELEILKDVSCTFRPGKNYMISGPSGSGKSTLLSLIARTGELPYEGAVRLGGGEVSAIAPDAYYKKVCPVFQEPCLFYATLEENILLGRDIPAERYREVVEKLNLGYLLERYRGQDLTPETVESLSGGERQRVAVARALAGRAEVYLLDEVTSALDPENARLVEELLLREDACVIHVCHKPVPDLDRLYDGRFVMEAGRLSPA